MEFRGLRSGMEDCLLRDQRRNEMKRILLLEAPKKPTFRLYSIFAVSMFIHAELCDMEYTCATMARVYKGSDALLR